MDDNFTPRVKDVIGYSKEEALRLGHDFIGTEHLILGLLRDGNGKANRTRRCGLHPFRLRLQTVSRYP